MIFYILKIISFPKRIFFLYLVLILLLSALVLNSLVLSIGNYGYWGKGIFSRTMFIPSLIILFVFIFTIATENSKKSFYFINLIFFITVFLFYFEINNWKKSYQIQKNILQSKVLKTNLHKLENKKNLILFYGPCNYNGVEIFNATWDLDSALNSISPNLEMSSFVPIQDWKVSIESSNVLNVHIFEYEMSSFESIYLWNYFENSFKKINKGSFNDKKSLFYDKRIECNLGINHSLEAEKFSTYFKSLYSGI